MNEINKYSPPERKIMLFRAMFRGREDVYARRYENSKTEKAGYAPECSVKWTRGLCDIKKTACAMCPNRRFSPMEDAAVEAHLRGIGIDGKPFVMGVYPLLTDDTCRFAAIDFDKKSWRADSASVMEVVKSLGWPVARERSRSGNGAHLWFFFDAPQPARFVREALTYMLTLAMERNPEIGLASYDRIFPNQDRLPKGGFGNLIALPLQGGARKIGNSVFVDERLVPYDDQWKFLSELPLVTSAQLATVRSKANAERRLLLPQREAEIERNEPWSLFSASRSAASTMNGDGGYVLPEEHVSDKIQVTLGNGVYIRQAELNPMLRGRLIRIASFVNPKYAEMQRMRLNVYATPRIIDCSINGDDYLVLPRGCLDNAIATIKAAGAEFEITDKRQVGTSLDVAFAGDLREEQRLAAKELVKHDTGVLAAGTAFGKTVLAAWMIAERKTSTLVLVNRRELQRQWIERLSQFLGLKKKEIGRLGGGVNKANGKIDVAVIQSLTRLDGEFLVNAVKGYGQILVDECHAVSAPSFEKVANAASARYFLGLSATVIRKDGHHPIIEMQCGPVRYRVDVKRMENYSEFRHVVKVRETPFVPRVSDVAEEGTAGFQDLVREIMECEARNEMIVRDVLENVRAGRSPVVLTERREHLEIFERLLRGKVDHLIVMRGGMRRKELKAIRAEIESIPPAESRVLLATGSYLGEGFDDARLDTLMLALPISWKGRLTQYAGRLHRLCDGKKEVRIYDYVDLRAEMCVKMFNKRGLGYKAIGYEVTMPNDTLDGWPEEVAIPVELRDNESYADSIKRIARDGLDAAVADLFVHAALENLGDGAQPSPSGEAESPLSAARSAAEKLLFKYLDSMPQTKGLFSLNGRLPIPFGPNPFMEVDLLCETKRLAIEIDGAFHFATAENYRRDRRKDYLLQKAGYFVQRFLAEDVVKRLDTVFTEIIRCTMEGRSS